MLATGDPRIKEKMDLDIQVTKLKMLKANHTALKYELEDKIRGHFPNKIKEEQIYIDCLQAHPAREEQFSMTIQGVTHIGRKEAGLSDDAVGNIARINNALDKIPQSLKNHEEQMARLKGELENAREEAEKPFSQEPGGACGRKLRLDLREMVGRMAKL